MKPFCYTTEVRFRDLDALGHVNNAVYLTYLEQARIRWWDDQLQGRPWREHGFLVVRTEIDYRKPLFFHDVVKVELFCSQIGTSSFTLSFKFRREKDDVVVAEGHTVQVMMDFNADRPRPIPPEALEWLKTRV
ncbi:acyl-CoA thioesterase [Holophaga foetida]|uniref:acyl-CoA thioesterase n=1 Tax=Holophaga foetida TaxID=35839 RepID=UPI0002471D04|nr:thioesterase family protein [Holophaga foetida]